MLFKALLHDDDNGKDVTTSRSIDSDDDHNNNNTNKSIHINTTGLSTKRKRNHESSSSSSTSTATSTTTTTKCCPTRNPKRQRQQSSSSAAAGAAATPDWNIVHPTKTLWVLYLAKMSTTKAAKTEPRTPSSLSSSSSSSSSSRTNKSGLYHHNRPSSCHVGNENNNITINTNNNNDLFYTNEVVQAIRQHDMETLQRLHDNGHDFNVCNNQGEYLIHLACRRGNFHVIMFLLSIVQVNVHVVDNMGRNPFHDFCWRPTMEKNEELICNVIQYIHPTWLIQKDKRGHVPMDYISNRDWKVWNMFLITNYSQLKKYIQQAWEKQ